MTTRVAGFALLAVGLVVTAVGLGARLFVDDDEGHHGEDSTPTFAADESIGADVLLTDLDGDALTVWIERAGQRITEYDDLHGGLGDLFVASAGLDWYAHQRQLVPGVDGELTVELPGAGTYRAVLQAAPSGGPDFIELGTSVEVGDGGDAGPAAADQNIAVDDRWTDGSLTLERQGLDFVLSEPFDGPDTMGAPAFLAMFHEDDLLFAHAHAEMVGDDRFRFTADLPGRGEYLAAVEFTQGDEPVTALFRFAV